MKLDCLEMVNLWLSDPERRNCLLFQQRGWGALMPEVVAEAHEDLCLDPGPPLLPPCYVQTLRRDFFGVSSHYSFPPSRVKMDVKLKHRRLPFCWSKTVVY